MKNRRIFTAVVTALCLTIGYVFAMGYYYPTPAWTKQGTGNQKLGFATIIGSRVHDSIAIGSSTGPCEVQASQACQLGTGSNGVPDTIQYRDHQILGPDGILSIIAYGKMKMGYAWYMEDWFEAGGYAANNALNGSTNCAKFSETAGHGTWLVTVVDGGGDNAETISIMTDERNGILRMLPNNAANDSVQAEMQGESFCIRSGYTSGFSTRWLPTDTNVTARMGMHLTGTTEAINVPGTDYIGFRLTNSGTATITNNVYFEMAKNSTNTSVLCGSIPANSFATMGFATLDGVTLIVTFNGTAVTNFLFGATAQPIPDDEALSPVMANRSISTGQAYLKIDYIGTVQER